MRFPLHTDLCMDACSHVPSSLPAPAPAPATSAPPRPPPCTMHDLQSLVVLLLACVLSVRHGAAICKAACSLAPPKLWPGSRRKQGFILGLLPRPRLPSPAPACVRPVAPACPQVGSRHAGRLQGSVHGQHPERTNSSIEPRQLLTCFSIIEGIISAAFHEHAFQETARQNNLLGKAVVLRCTDAESRDCPLQQAGP